MAATFALLCAGCATDTGVYQNKNGENGLREFHGCPAEVERTFELPESKEVISPPEASTLVGRWRCFVDTDSHAKVHEMFYFCSSTWHLDEYEFRNDGTYSVWHVAKNDSRILPHTEEGGRWKFVSDRLHILREFVSRRKIFGGVERIATDVSEKWTEYDIAWHSDKEFTLRYHDPTAFVRDMWGRYTSDASGWYDSEGCFRWKLTYGAEYGGGSQEFVTSPLRFKKR